MEVNIKKILESKSPAIAKWIPNFAIKYLRKIIHEDEVNRYLNDFESLSSIDFARATLKRMNISYRAEGLTDIDPNGRYIFASNHPFGGLDGMMIADIINSKFGDSKLIVNDILMNLTPLTDIFVPINKHGKQDIEKATTYNNTFNSNVPIVTFPAGLCSRRKNGVVIDSEWKHSFIKKAIQSKRDIVPVYFDGKLSDFFYNLSSIRTKLGVKANIEMLYLVDEMFKQSGGSFVIQIGKPISWKELQNGASNKKWAGKVKEIAYALKK